MGSSGGKGGGKRSAFSTKMALAFLAHDDSPALKRARGEHLGSHEIMILLQVLDSVDEYMTRQPWSGIDR